MSYNDAPTVSVSNGSGISKPCKSELSAQLARITAENVRDSNFIEAVDELVNHNGVYFLEEVRLHRAYARVTTNMKLNAGHIDRLTKQLESAED